MKKRIYTIINLKQFIILSMTAILALTFVFGLDIFYMKTEQASTSAQKIPLIIIDAGHGGEDGGTSSSSGILEKDINLSIAIKCEKLFKLFGFDTMMTRTDDKLIYDSDSSTMREKKVSDIHKRMKIMSDNPNSIFLSIHQNHYDESKYNGAQVFYSKGNSESQVIAEYIQKQIKETLQNNNTREIKASGTEIYLLHNAKTPAVMVECGFLSNAGEAQRLNDNTYQTQMSITIFNAVKNYLVNKQE